MQYETVLVLVIRRRRSKQAGRGGAWRYQNHRKGETGNLEPNPEC